MDHTPTIIISLILGLLLGAAGVYFGLEYLERRGYQEVVSSNPTVVFDECETLPAEIQQRCANNVLLQRAVQNNDVSLCEGITSTSQKESCLTTLSNLETFDASMAEFCQGHENRILCTELLQVLAADMQQNAALCASISSEGLRKECVSRLPVVEDVQVVVQQELAATFGPICPEPATISCKQDAASMISAVLSGDLSKCENTGNFLDLCLRETELYALFTGVGADGCESFPEVPPLKSAPRALESVLTQESCLAELVLAGENTDRFGYLIQ